MQSDRKVDHPGMMQEFDQPLIEKFELFLKGDQKCNFLSGITNIDMNIEVRKKYPVLMKILEASVDQDGTTQHLSLVVSLSSRFLGPEKRY